MRGITKGTKIVMLGAVCLFGMIAARDVHAEDGVQMHRLYNPNSGEHFYTAVDVEYEQLKANGWKDEGNGWIAPVHSDAPVYRLYNPNAGDHHYTMSTYERDMLMQQGWKYEGIGWYSASEEEVPLYRQYNPYAQSGSHNYTALVDENNMLIRSGWQHEGVAWYGVGEAAGSDNILAYTSTKAENLVEIGRRAYNSDPTAQEQIIQIIAKAADREWDQYGFLKSVIISQVINESGWCSFTGASIGGILPQDNNVLGMNAELLNNRWSSPWNGAYQMRNVPQNVNGRDIYGYESMRVYPDIETCLADFAAFKVGIHPDVKYVKDYNYVVDVGLQGYATDPQYNRKVKNTIERFNLTRFDQ